MPIQIGAGIQIGSGLNVGGTPNLGCFVPGSCPIAPGAPLIGTAYVTGGTTASITYSAPLSNGGSTITRYMATSSPGGITGNLSQSGSGNIAVSGLAPGASYTFSVQAINAYGSSTPSLPSNSITEWSAPGAPTIGTAVVTSGTTANISYTAPASTGGQAITSYTATSTPGGITGTLNQAGSGNISVSGLTKGTSYTFTVAATNSVGTGSASAASNSITPATVPGAPTIGSATATGSTTANVAFTAPGCNGGSSIISYTATSNVGGITGTLSQSGSGTINVSGLTAATAYTFTVTATNSVGTGPSSSASNLITTAGPPGSQSYTTVGTYTWVAPAGVTSVSVVAIGGGSGGYNGQPSSWVSCIAGGCSYFINTSTVKGGGGHFNSACISGSVSSGYTGDGGGCGGINRISCTIGSGGGGAGGYSGNGGSGGGGAGAGGGGGGGRRNGMSYCAGAYGGEAEGGGGGVGIFGLGTSGAGGSHCVSCNYGRGGSGGGNGGRSKGIQQPGSGGSAAAGLSGVGTGSAGACGVSCGATPSPINSITTAGGGNGGVSGGTDTSHLGSGAGSWYRGAGGGGGGGGAFGGGGGGYGYGFGGVGGGLGYKNNITVVPGNSYTVVVGRGGAGIGDTPVCNYGGGYLVYNRRGSSGSGGSGAVRIVWPGSSRRFPSTCVGTP